jgi:hypothetical protein
MKRIGLSILISALLLGLFSFGVYSQVATPTPATPVQTQIQEAIDAAQTEDLLTQTITPVVDIRERIPISLPVFVPDEFTTTQVVTVPLSMILAMPVEDEELQGLQFELTLNGVPVAAVPFDLELVFTVEPSPLITEVRVLDPQVMLTTTIVSVIPDAVAPTPTPPPPPAPAPPAVEASTVITNANLRTGPGLNFPVIGGLLAGREVDIVGQNAAGTWYLLSDGSWIAAFLIANPPANIPVVESPAPPAPATQELPVVPEPLPAEPPEGEDQEEGG